MLYEIKVPTVDGTTTTLENFTGEVLLIVNTASGCGLAPQFAELQQLYEQYHSQGFSVLGFPCNQFARQEPLDAQAAAQSCQLTYNVSFPMFGKIKVNGPQTHPLYQHLKAQANGLFSNSIKWNFTKFLVDQQGHVVERFAPTTSPKDIESHIVKLLS